MANFTTTGSDTFPAGMVRQVKSVDIGVIASGSSDVYFPTSGTFDNAILSSSDVFLTATGTCATRVAANDCNITLLFSSANGGSLGAGASGHIFNYALMSYTAHIHMRVGWAGNMMVTNPNSTTPTYQVFVNRVSGQNVELEAQSIMTMMEITR